MTKVEMFVWISLVKNQAQVKNPLWVWVRRKPNLVIYEVLQMETTLTPHKLVVWGVSLSLVMLNLDNVKWQFNGVLGIPQKQLLQRVDEPDNTVLEHHQLLHMLGVCCTDRSTSQEPWWDQSWQVLCLPLFSAFGHYYRRPCLVGSLREQRSSRRRRVRRG
jgi:hypothetical protein